MDLDKILREKGMTKAALAVKMGRSKQLMTTIGNNPRLETMEAIARALEMPVYRLLISDKELDELSSVNLELIYDIEEAMGLAKGELIQNPQKVREIADIVSKVELLLKLAPDTLFKSSEELERMLAERAISQA